MSWEIDTESHRALVFCSAAPRIPRMPRIPRRPWSNSCVTRLRAWPIACRRRSSSCMRTDGISSALYGQPMDHYFGKWSTNGWNGLADFLTNTWLAEIHGFFVGLLLVLLTSVVTFPKNVLPEMAGVATRAGKHGQGDEEGAGATGPPYVRDKAKWRLHEQKNKLSWVVTVIVIIIIIHPWTIGQLGKVSQWYDHDIHISILPVISNPSSILRRACAQPRNSVSRRSSAELCALNRWRWECIMTIHRIQPIWYLYCIIYICVCTHICIIYMHVYMYPYMYNIYIPKQNWWMYRV